MEEKDLNILLECRVGSHAYGLNTPESDEDFKGFAVAKSPYYLGFLKKFSELESKSPDRVIYNITKFFDLAANCNPNILDVLFCDPKDIIKESYSGLLVLANANLFLSAKAEHTFSGYAWAQLKRIKTHRNYILNPQEKEPLRKDFGLGNKRTISATEMGILAKLEQDNPDEFKSSVVSTVIEYYYLERAYCNARKEWEQYQNWKVTRNPKRAALEAKYHMDTKHAMHLVRLLRMGKEILSGQGVIVKRPDREELLAIRNGAWTYDQLVEYAEREYNSIAELAKTTTLPKEPDRNLLDNLCTNIIEEALGYR